MSRLNSMVAGSGSEADAGGVAALREAGGAVAAVDDAARQIAGEEIDEVGAVHAVGRVPARRVGDLHRRDRLAVVAEVVRLRADQRAVFFRGGAEADALQMAHRVRREIDAGADLAERRGLFVDRDAEAVSDEGIGGEQAADAAADDRDVGFGFCH